MPLMTDKGSFIINGTERVIVANCTARRACSSKHDKEADWRTAPDGFFFSAQIIPLSWLVAGLRVRPEGRCCISGGPPPPRCQ